MMNINFKITVFLFTRVDFIIQLRKKFMKTVIPQNTGEKFRSWRNLNNQTLLKLLFSV